MSNIGLKVLIGFVFAIVGGVICDLIFKLNDDISFLTGILLFISCELFLLILAHENMQKVSNLVLSLVKSLPEEGHFSDFYTIISLSSLRKHTRKLIDYGIEFHKGEEIPRIWTECITNIETSLTVVSYVSVSHWWRKGYAIPNLEIQKHKVTVGKKIVRIFLWDTNDEYEKLLKLAEVQKQSGILVKNVPFNTILSDKAIKKCLKKIGTPDVGVIDNKWAALLFLDSNRDIKSLTLTHNQEIIDTSREYIGLVEPMAQGF